MTYRGWQITKDQNLRNLYIAHRPGAILCGKSLEDVQWRIDNVMIRKELRTKPIKMVQS